MLNLRRKSLFVTIIITACADNCYYCSSNGTCSTDGCVSGYTYVFDDPQRVCSCEYYYLGTLEQLHAFNCTYLIFTCVPLKFCILLLT